MATYFCVGSFECSNALCFVFHCSFLDAGEGTLQRHVVAVVCAGCCGSCVHRVLWLLCAQAVSYSRACARGGVYSVGFIVWGLYYGVYSVRFIVWVYSVGFILWGFQYGGYSVGFILWGS
jgi:hypothetical protein